MSPGALSYSGRAIKSATIKPGAARVLLSPFRAGAAHIVKLGPVRVEQRRPQPAPPPSGRVQAARRRRGRKQHSRDVRIQKCAHFEPRFGVRLSYRSQVPGQEAEQRVNASYQRLTFKSWTQTGTAPFPPRRLPGGPDRRLLVLMSWMVVQ